MGDEPQVPKKRTFRKFAYRGIDLAELLKMPVSDVMPLIPARQRRHFARGLSPAHKRLIMKLRKAKKTAPPGEKPAPVKTHLRNTVIIPEMVGSVVGIYNGKVFNQVEIKPEMIGHYFGEFSVTYRAVTHGRPGIGSTTTRFIV